MRITTPIEFNASDLPRGICPFCRRLVGKSGYLELCTVVGERLIYPHTILGEPIAYVAHANCGPDTGYSYALKRLAARGAGERLLTHLEGKLWFSQVYRTAVQHAARLARR